MSISSHTNSISSRWMFYVFLTLLWCNLRLEASSNDWPGFRGPNSDGSAFSGNKFNLTQGGQLNVAWRSGIGPGYSGVSIVEGRAVTMFMEGENDVAAAFDTKTGKKLWSYTIGPAYKGHDGSHDGPIATPLISNGRVFSLDPTGKLFALDFATGKEIWTANVADGMKDDRKPLYGFATSPLMAGGVLVVEVGADQNRAIAGFDPASGAKKWTLGDDKVNYQSPILWKWNGTDQVVAAGNSKLFGIEPTKGEILWEFAHEGLDYPIAAGAMVPVPAGDGYLFLKNKLDTSTMIHLTAGSDGKIKVEPVWTAGVLKSSYSVPVYYKGYLYGYNGRTILTCVDAKTGELKWRSRDPGDGFLLLLDGNLIIQAKEGTLHIGPASPDGWKETARIELFQQVSWTNPSFAEGAIFSRGQGELARIEWSASKTAAQAAINTLGAAPATSRFAKFVQEVESAPDKKAAVDQFMATIHSYPYVEWPNTVHFLYRGTADDMGIAGDMIGIRREDPMLRVPGTDLFYYSIQLEPDALIEYQFIKNYEEKLKDPKNDRFIKEDEGDFSLLIMPGWKEPAFLKAASSDRRGRIESHELNIQLRERTSAKFDVYLPAGYQNGNQRYPVVLILGADEAETKGLLPNIFDNLISVSVQPVIAIFVSNTNYGSKAPDYPEVADLDASIVVKEILPFVDANYRTTTEPISRAIMGGGFAGYMAIYTALKFPGVFGNIAMQSIEMLDEDAKQLKKQMRTNQEQPLRVYHDWGLYELRATREGWDMRRTNTEFNAFLRERGYKPAGGETHQSWGWAIWRNQTDRWLTAFFPITQ
jgi:outer membrane protein assembly factor BamB/enterochelin esterase-like enzyme